MMIIRSLLAILLLSCMDYALALARFENAGLLPCKTTEGFKRYRPSSKICCDQALWDRRGNQECCGVDIINADEEICCDGTAHPRFVNCSASGQGCQEQTCCGPKVVLANQDACCFGHFIKLTPEQNQNRDHLKCCAAGVIADSRAEMCCGNTSLQLSPKVGCCAGMPFYTEFQRCETVMREEKLICKDEKFCGDQTYSIREKSCCGGVLNSTISEMDPHNILEPNPHFQCCGIDVIDPTTDKCCLADPLNGYPTHAIPRNFHCCGHGYYDKTCQECIDGKVVARPSGHMRCGGKVIDPQLEGCCASHEPYNTTMQKCCLGGTSSVIQVQQECCNGAGLGLDQMCCQGLVPCTRRRADHNDCCLDWTTGAARSFNNKTQRCKDGQLFYAPPEGKEYCGDQTYDPESQFCCGSVVSDNSTGKDDCCGYEPFDSREQTCCFENLFDIPSDKARCCPLDGQARERHDPNSDCTHTCPDHPNVYFDLVDETCCDGVVHPYDDEASCCGSFNIRHGREGCCAEQLPFKLRRRNSIDCCGDTELFTPRTSECRNNQLVSKQSTMWDTEALCDNSLLNSVDSVVRHACTSSFALTGKLKNVSVKQRAEPDSTIIEFLLKRVRPINQSLPIGLGYNTTNIPRRLTFTVEVPMEKITSCTKRIGRGEPMIVVFFNTQIRGRVVSIGPKDSIRIVRRNVLKNIRLNGEFCERMYQAQSPSIGS